jgi:hypothetical protein
MRKNDIDKWIGELSGVFTRPIVLPTHNPYIGEQQKQEIIISRLLDLITATKNKELPKFCSDEEALYYLSEASLVAPLSHDHFKIFLYLFRKWCIKYDKDLTDFVRQLVVLDEYQERQLYELKAWIKKKQKVA